MAGELDRLRKRSRDALRARALSKAAFKFDKTQNPEDYKDRVKRFLISLPLLGGLGSIIPLFLLGPDFTWLGLTPLAVQLAIGTQANKITYLYRVKDGETALQQDPEGTRELLSQQRREIEE